MPPIYLPIPHASPHRPTYCPVIVATIPVLLHPSTPPHHLRGPYCAHQAIFQTAALTPGTELHDIRTEMGLLPPSGLWEVMATEMWRSHREGLPSYWDSIYDGIVGMSGGQAIESIPVDIGEQEIRFSGMQNPSTPVTPWVLVTATMVSDIKLLGMRAGYLTMFIRTFTVQEVRIMDGLVVVMDVDGGRDVGGLRMEDGEFELWWSLAKGGWQSGIPQGREIQLHGRFTYVAEPPEDGTVIGIVVIVSNAFGWTLPNNRVLADTMAAEGSFRVYLPEFMNGSAAPARMLDDFNNVLSDMSLTGWFWKPYYVVRVLIGILPVRIWASFPSTMPQVTSFVTALRENEAASLPIGAAGYCWGGKHVLNLASGDAVRDGKPLIDAAFVAHPSYIVVPDEINPIQRPLSVAVGDKDLVFKPKDVEQTKAIFAQKDDVPSEVIIYPGAQHGFAVRCNQENKKETRQGEEARKQAVNWFSVQFGKLK
ncbi:hypothetical protein Q9189_004661 [Teloschistes chrysophthalmus]